MGVVWRARDRLGGGDAAVKTIHVPDEEIARRFTREASALARIEHPAIVRYLAHGVTEEGELFLAMEWVEGEDLAARIARSGLTVAHTVQVITCIAEALAAAHAKGTIHRDVKPSNVILAGGDPRRAKVLDFGLARVVGALGPESRLTQAGVLLGTPGYVSPEQIRGDEVDARTDVFALGAVAFECLTGKPAFVGNDVLAVLGRILFDAAPRVNESREEPVDEELDALVAAMLSNDARARPVDMSVVLARLEGLGAVAGAPPTREAPRQSAIGALEQRVVGVVVARAPDERPDTGATWLPEHATTLRERATRLGARFGAQVEVLPEGAVVAVVSGALEPTDLAVRTARVALSVADLVPDAVAAAVIGRSIVAERIPVGDAIDRASAMLARGQRGVHVDRELEALLGDRFEIEDRAGSSMLRRERDATFGMRTLLGRSTPFVGRTRELEMLERTFDDVIEEGAARAVLVTGAAGLGKTRLLAELLPRVLGRGPVRLLAGKGDELLSRAAFSVIAPALRAAAGVRLGCSLEEGRARVRELVSSATGDTGRADAMERRARVAAFVGELAGIPFADESSAELAAARRDPLLMGELLRAAFIDLIEGEAAQKPVLIVLDDLHWADAPSIGLVASALEALPESPLMVLALARPKADDASFRALTDRGALRLDLATLSRRGGVRLAREVLGAAISEDHVTRLVERAEGNPFFLEELIRAAATGADPSALPDSVLGSVEARLAELDPAARLVLRAASLFGETFFRGGVLAALGGDDAIDVDGWLGALEQRELVARSATSRHEGEAQFVFRHALVREASYATLLERDRAVGHRRAAQWLTAVGERNPVLLAEHWERGDERERAAACWLRAAREALEGNDLAGAVASARRGASLTTDRAVLGELGLARAEASWWNGEPDSAFEAAREAAEHLRETGGPWWAALAIAGESCAMLGRTEGAQDHFDVLIRDAPADARFEPWAVAVARVGTALAVLGDLARARQCQELIEANDARVSASGSSLVAGRLEQLRGAVVGMSGDAAASARHHAKSADHFERAGAVRLATMQRMNAAGVLGNLGLLDDALPMIDDAIASARKFRLPYNLAYGEYVKGGILKMLGRFDDAVASLSAALEGHRRAGEVRLVAGAAYELAEASVGAGDLDRAESEARGAVALSHEIEVQQSSALAVLGHVLLTRGHVEEGLRVAREGVELLSEGADRDVLAHLVYAEALHANGQIEAAREAVRHAHAIVTARAAAITDLAERHAFLTRVPDHARVIARVREWGVTG